MNITPKQRRALQRLTVKYRHRMATDANITRYMTEVRAILAG